MSESSGLTHPGFFKNANRVHSSYFLNIRRTLYHLIHAYGVLFAFLDPASRLSDFCIGFVDGTHVKLVGQIPDRRITQLEFTNADSKAIVTLSRPGEAGMLKHIQRNYPCPVKHCDRWPKICLQETERKWSRKLKKEVSHQYLVNAQRIQYECIVTVQLK